MQYTKSKTLSLKNHPDYRESWVQDIIADDPSVLGLGDLDLIGKERIQPRAGRLDLLLQDSETKRRYEVELQLGTVDESHIIRTIEYWDIERKRYPQYDHCAVIIAEDITSCFLNVISLFNGNIPLIAIKMSAIQVEDHLCLHFTKVLDEVALGLVEDDELSLSAPTDRQYWENKATPEMVKLADELLEISREIEPSLQLNYNKHYIGLVRNGQAFNFIAFRPKKSRINLEIKLPKEDRIDQIIEDAELDTLEYATRWQQYRLSLEKKNVNENRETLKSLFEEAYERRK